MEWTIGLTCVPLRFSSTLPTTLLSLEGAGFPKPRLFVDGADSLPAHLQGYEATFRVPAVRAFGNWFLTLLELYVRKPRAERFMIVQDDVIFYPNLCQYLERVAYPERGYLNLFTYPQNEKPLRGFYESTRQDGKGALALVFNRDAVQMLLGSQHMIHRPMDPNRGHLAIDGGVVSSATKARFKEYVHNPTLCQHISVSSSLFRKDCPTSRTWRGNDFDALDLLKPEERPTANAFNPPTPPRHVFPEVRESRGKVLATHRIGLVGYCSQSGVGEVNRTLAEFAEIDVWLVKPHDGVPSVEPPPVCDIMSCPTGKKLDEFLRLVDIVLFAEQPPYDRLLQLCRRAGIRTVCLASHEWLPPACRQWASQVDQFICPTQHCFEEIRGNVNAAHFPWGADAERFRFQQREQCNRFLYLHGRGGVHDSKGARAIRGLLERWPEVPLTVVGAGSSWGNARVEPRRTDNTQLYELGDVLLVPGAVSGLGLECIEAAAAGMPVISTNAAPWSEYPALERLSATRGLKKLGRPVDYWTVDQAALEAACRRWLGQPIAMASRAARHWALNRSWVQRGQVLTRFLRGEFRDQESLDDALAGTPPLGDKSLERIQETV